MRKDSLLKSSVWISVSGFISRALSVAYIIPWNIWIGASLFPVANALYGRVYNIYNLFLIIATAGIPSAISKEIAAYNSIGHYSQSEKVLKKYSMYMTVIGIILAAIMFFGAKYVAIILAAGDMRVVTPIKYLSITMLIIPALGIMRGYIQGFAFISFSAFSQVIEQIARVAYMLYATYTIMILQHGNYMEAVNQSTLASFIGATLAYLYLLWMRHRIRRNINISPSNNNNLSSHSGINFNNMLKTAIPFLLVDTIMVVLQLFDQTSFSLVYKLIIHASTKTIDYLFSMFGFQANKLIMILVSLAISISASVIPALSAQITKKIDKRQISRLLQNIVEFTFFILLPSTLGMIAISSPLWTVFTIHSKIGTQILIVSCIEAIIYCLFMILENILQVTHNVKKSLHYLLLAYILKLLLQVPLTIYLGPFGPLVSSTIAFIIGSYFAFKLINSEFKIIDIHLLKRIFMITVNSSAMLFIVSISVYLLSLAIDDRTKLPAMLILSIGAIIGIVVYGLLSLKDGSLKILKEIRNTEIY